MAKYRDLRDLCDRVTRMLLVVANEAYVDESAQGELRDFATEVALLAYFVAVNSKGLDGQVRAEDQLIGRLVSLEAELTHVMELGSLPDVAAAVALRPHVLRARRGFYE